MLIFLFFSLSGSSKRTLCLDVWSKFLSCIGCVPTNETEKQTVSKEVLGDEQVNIYFNLNRPHSIVIITSLTFCYFS